MSKINFLLNDSLYCFGTQKYVEKTQKKYKRKGITIDTPGGNLSLVKNIKAQTT